MKEVQRANLVRLESMVMSLVRIARVVESASTEIPQWSPQNVSSVRLVGHQKLAAPNVNPARLEVSAASNRYYPEKKPVELEAHVLSVSQENFERAKIVKGQILIQHFVCSVLMVIFRPSAASNVSDAVLGSLALAMSVKNA